MDNLILLNIKGISYSQTQSGAYALILEEESVGRKLPIVIGSFEAQSIALALEKDIRPPRPLTHDLFTSLANKFKIGINAIHIHKLEDGIFYSNILFVDEFGKEKSVDSRTSDAIALAVRFKAPIYALDSVMKKAGIYLEESKAEEQSTTKTIKEIKENIEVTESKIENDFKNKPSSELEQLMNEAVKNENYELAAKIRDELEKRSNN